MNDRPPPIPRGPQQSIASLQALHRLLGSGLIWAGAAFLLVMIVLFYTVRIGRVSGEQIGILLDRLSGELTVIDQSGVKIYNGLLSDFYVLDRTLQAVEMTGETTRGDRRGRDDLKVKTVDGSDVYVDLKVQYKIDPNMAIEVIRTSGPGDNYKTKWARDYIRSICRNYLGELTTEQFYDASQRDAKIVLAQNELNERLQPFGIVVDSVVIPRRPNFYKEYEEMIKKKKLADQAVLEEQSKALAAKQKQQTMIVQENNKKNVAVERFQGEMEQKVIQAKADAERAKKAADAYYERITVQAEANLYAREKEAEAILAEKKAEADGIMALKRALEGKGGRNMVKLEYARKLKQVGITGRPFIVEGKVERFEHLREGATTQGRK